MTTPNPKLSPKPCPCCGGIADTSRQGDWHIVECNDDYCGLRTQGFATKEMAIESWNSRAINQGNPYVKTLERRRLSDEMQIKELKEELKEKTRLLGTANYAINDELADRAAKAEAELEALKRGGERLFKSRNDTQAELQSVKRDLKKYKDFLEHIGVVTRTALLQPEAKEDKPDVPWKCTCGQLNTSWATTCGRCEWDNTKRSEKADGPNNCPHPNRYFNRKGCCDFCPDCAAILPPTPTDIRREA